MAYDPKRLFEELDAKLSEVPRTSLLAVAQWLGVDRHTLERATRRSTGKTFRAYQAQKLLETAHNLFLQNPPLSVKEIAARLGYGSASAFSRFARTKTGQSPGNLRAGT